MAATPAAPTTVAPEGVAAMLDVLEIVGRLKTTKRAGWVRVGVAAPESIADHMYRMAVCGWFVNEAGVDATRCVKIALAHDMAEALVGDITPADGVPEEEKHARERAAMDHIGGALRAAGHASAAAELMAAYEEYEGATTREAVYVKDIDKFEMALQAYEYERDQGGGGSRLSEFFDSVPPRLRTPLVGSWMAELATRRAALPPTPPPSPSSVTYTAPSWWSACLFSGGVVVGAVLAAALIARRRPG